MFKGYVYVTLKNGVLDPQGVAAMKSLKSLGYDKIEEVRVGKFIEVLLQAASPEAALEELKAISEKLLANLVVEDYRVEVVEVSK